MRLSSDRSIIAQIMNLRSTAEKPIRIRWRVARSGWGLTNQPAAAAGEVGVPPRGSASQVLLPGEYVPDRHPWIHVGNSPSIKL